MIVSSKSTSQTLTFHHCGFFFNVLMCVCLYNSNIPNIVLRVRHRPQLLLADSGEHFPHVLSDQGEPPSVLQCVSVELVCPLVMVSRRDSVVVVFQDGLARMYLDNAKLPCIGEKMKHVVVLSLIMKCLLVNYFTSVVFLCLSACRGGGSRSWRISKP